MNTFFASSGTTSVGRATDEKGTMRRWELLGMAISAVHAPKANGLPVAPVSRRFTLMTIPAMGSPSLTRTTTRLPGVRWSVMAMNRLRVS